MRSAMLGWLTDESVDEFIPRNFVSPLLPTTFIVNRTPGALWCIVADGKASYEIDPNGPYEPV